MSRIGVGRVQVIQNEFEWFVGVREIRILAFRNNFQILRRESFDLNNTWSILVSQKSNLWKMKLMKNFIFRLGWGSKEAWCTGQWVVHKHA